MSLLTGLIIFDDSYPCEQAYFIMEIITFVDEYFLLNLLRIKGYYYAQSKMKKNILFECSTDHNIKQRGNS